MPTLTITAKGQVTFRREILEHLGARPGDKIIVDKLADGRIEARVARATGTISDAFDCLKRDTAPCLSIAEINEIASRGWASKR